MSTMTKPTVSDSPSALNKLLLTIFLKSGKWIKCSKHGYQNITTSEIYTVSNNIATNIVYCPVDSCIYSIQYFGSPNPGWHIINDY